MRAHGTPDVPSKVDATRYLAQVEADLLRGSWADPKLGRVSFGEWVEHWGPTTANLRPGRCRHAAGR